MSSLFGNWFSGNKEANPDGTPGGEPGQQGTSPGIDVVVPVASVAPTPREPPALPKPRYGIDDAIRLMRTLPVDDNVDLVVRVIKNTLQSLDVRVADIIDDAGRRQEALSNAITEHETSIVKLEREIEARRNEIAHLQDELAETSTVRERLELAEQLPATPQAPRVAIAGAPATAKKAATPQQRSVPPPVPAGASSFRPKLGNAEPKKNVPLPSAPEGAKSAEAKTPEEEELVESRDFVEKAP
jgi:hypothetical protein